MTNKIATVLEGEVLRIQPAEDLVASSIADQRTEIMAALEAGAGQVVLDLSGVQHVDSLGISLIVGLFKSCQTKDCTFSVEGVNGNILRVFKLFKLPQYFPVKGA